VSFSIWRIFRSPFAVLRDLGGYESPSDAMVFHFDQLYGHLLVILEAAEMPEARADLIAKWSEFKKFKGGVRYTDQSDDFDHLTSPVLDRLIECVRGPLIRGHCYDGVCHPRRD
jgi:hypothetical protein